MSFQQNFLHMVSRQQPELRRAVYAAVTNPEYSRSQKIDAISAAVRQWQPNAGAATGATGGTGGGAAYVPSYGGGGLSTGVQH